MFEAWEPMDGYPMLDEPELTEADYEAMVADLIAADPEPWPELTADELRARADRVIAQGESGPITGVLVDQLKALDISILTDDQRIGLSVGYQRVANYGEAHRGLAVVATVQACPDAALVPRELHASSQLEAALGLGSGAMGEMIAASTQMAQMLPGAQEMALAGNLSWRKASSLATATIGMRGDGPARVEDKVLAKSWGRSPSAHDAAVRRAVDQVDPDHADRNRKDRERDIRMAKHHLGAGMGQLFTDMRSEDLDLVWTAADAFARRLKAGGDPRALDELRVEFLVHSARSYLSHGDPSYCDRVCDPLPPHPQPAEPLPPEPLVPESFTNHDDDEGDEPDPGEPGGGGDGPDPQPAPSGNAVEPVTPSPPIRHGRPIVLHVTWDLTSLLGLTSHCGELRDSGTMLPPSAMRDLLAGGGRIRRMVIDPATGEQLDLTPVTWLLPATDGRKHRQPVVLTLTTTERLADLPDELVAALDATDPGRAAMLGELLDYPLTAEDLDNQPDADEPSPALAEFMASRAAHPVNPCAGPTAASAGDLDHHQARSAGGKTVRTNLGPFTRRWHRIKTFTDWTVRQIKHGWEWTSPTGRKYTIEPHDYRLGP